MRARQSGLGGGFRAVAVMVAATVLAFGCALPDDPLVIELSGAKGRASRFDLRIAAGYLPGSLDVQLDGAAVEVAVGRHSLFGGVVPLAFDVRGGRHVLRVRARFLTSSGIAARSKKISFFVPTFTRTDLPALVSSWPTQGTRDLAIGEWIQLEFSARPGSAMVERFRLSCNQRLVSLDVHRVRPTFLMLNPHGQLPAGSRCLFSWWERGGARRFVFSTAPAGARAVVEYDRERAGLSSPFPDDYFTVRDRTRATGLRISLPENEPNSPVDRFAAQLAADLEPLDGWSPVGHLVIALSDAVDPAALPQRAAESIHPASALQLLDVDPRSPSFGQRFPFAAEVREDRNAQGDVEHSLLVFPLLPAAPGVRYALIVTRALRAAPSRPFEPSPFMARVLRPFDPDDSRAVRRARNRVRSTLWVAERLLSPPIPRDDIALVFRFTAGTLPGLSDDLLHVRRQLGVRPAPRFTLDRMTRESGVLEAVATGTWHAPRWRSGANFRRDVRGRPVIEGTKPVPITIAFPRERSPKGAPVIIYQHGNPGSAEEEVPIEARRALAAAGFAVLGFTDVFNRELAWGDESESAILGQLASSLIALDRDGRLPDYWLQTHAEQLAFVRLVHGLAELDVLPVGAPDGVPDLDLDAPIGYLGMSEGANHAPAFLAYSPEVAAAALVVGGAPIAGSLTHQIDGTLAEKLVRFALEGRGRHLWLVLSLLQTAIDRQDPIHHARFLYRDPIEIAGTTRKASILLTAGVEDHRVPNRFTDALAWWMGPLPMLEPVGREVSFLASVEGPLRANIRPDTTAAYVQIVPAGLTGASASADCDPLLMGHLAAVDGHFCAQIAPTAIQQRLSFFLSALEGAAPVIANPMDMAK